MSARACPVYALDPQYPSFLWPQVLTSGWTTTYSLGCQHIDRSGSAESMRVRLRLVWAKSMTHILCNELTL